MKSFLENNCFKCKHHIVSHVDFFGRAVPIDLCQRDKKDQFDYVTGNMVPNIRFRFCRDEREKLGFFASLLSLNCGPDGAYFEKDTKELAK